MPLDKNRCIDGTFVLDILVRDDSAIVGSGAVRRVARRGATIDCKTFGVEKIPEGLDLTRRRFVVGLDLERVLTPPFIYLYFTLSHIKRRFATFALSVLLPVMQKLVDIVSKGALQIGITVSVGLRIKFSCLGTDVLNYAIQVLNGLILFVLNRF